MRLRYVADLAPPVPGFRRTDVGRVVSFLPLESIWHDDRFDASRTIEFRGDVASFNPVAENDILVPKVSPTFAHGRVAVATELVGGRALATSEVFVLRGRSHDDARFLAYRLRARDVLTMGVASWTGVAGLKRVSADFVRDVVIPEWAWTKRGAIADFLDRECGRIAAAIDAARRATDRLEEPALALAAAEFDAQPTGRIGYRFSVQLGKMLDEKRVDQADTKPYLRNANVHWDALRLNDLKEMTFDATDQRRFSLARGDLLVCEGGEPGRAAIWNGEVEDCYFQKALHRVRPYADDSTRYLLWALRTLSLRNTFAVDGPGRYTHLTAEMLRAVRVPMPAAGVQHERAAAIDDVARRSRLAAAALAAMGSRLAEYRDALITEAVTGQLDVTAVSDAQMDERLHQRC